MTETTNKRIRRVSFTSELPTEANPVGTVVAHVAGGEPVTYARDLTGIGSFIATGFLAGIRERLSSTVSGLKDVAEITAKLVSEIADLDKGVFSANIGVTTKARAIPDILRAWASLYKEDIDNAEVFEKYSAAWEARDDEGKKAIRTNALVSAAIYTLQAERKAASAEAKADTIELPSLEL